MKKHNAIILTVLGILAIIAGILMTSVLKIDFGSLKFLSYLLSGIGCAAAGYGITEIAEKDIMKKYKNKEKKDGKVEFINAQNDGLS